MNDRYSITSKGTRPKGIDILVLYLSVILGRVDMVDTKVC